MGTLELVQTRAIFSTRVDALKVTLEKIQVHHIYMVMYVVVALSMIWFPQGPIQWLEVETGITAEPLALLFGVCALIIGYDPGRRVFLACMIPIAVYFIIFTAYIVQTSFFSLVSAWFVIMTVALMLTNYYRRLGGIRIWHIYSFCMVILGIAIMNHPDRGTAAWLRQSYGIPGQTFGFLMVVAAVTITLKPTREVFMYAVIPTLGFYIIAASVYAILNTVAGATVLSVTLLSLSSLTWSFARMNQYFDES